MFIIPCKYNETSNHILALVKEIRHFHPHEKIMVVDSNSEDKSYFEKLDPYNVILEDVSNDKWMIGAYWHGYVKFPNEDFYFCLHDSMHIKANLDYLKDKDLTLIATFNRSVSKSFNAWNERLINETKIDSQYIKIDGLGCYGPMFLCKNKVITSLFEKGVHKLLPSSKAEVGYMEGAMGLCLESLGYNLMECSLFGDILQLESPGGKSGVYPHNTTWQFPIEKFYGSHIDQKRT